MNPFIILLTLMLLLVSPLASQTSCAASDTEQLTAMLHEFMEGASHNDAAAHDRFWAQDLVYTSSGGERFGKAEIMQGLSAPTVSESDAPAMVYSAQDIDIRSYGDTAVVAFRLLGETEDGTGLVRQFFNTGTFIKRGGTWKAVAWQATIIPPPDPR